MEELKIIKYLLDEIEAEQDYNTHYDKEREKGRKNCREMRGRMVLFPQIYAS